MPPKRDAQILLFFLIKLEVVIGNNYGFNIK